MYLVAVTKPLEEFNMCHRGSFEVLPHSTGSTGSIIECTRCIGSCYKTTSEFDMCHCGSFEVHPHTTGSTVNIIECARCIW